ncbi:chorismate--pyruvate lyase family protein [Candidatus Methylocalor cossyra]|uniref:chorismate--pyruvate lyase family protein n=1 Tax=Candidatus Methylocalor cossyra TaxID=3108543 RepID=UPI0032B269B2
MTAPSQLFSRPPRWVPAADPRWSVPPAVAAWLFEPGSLTHRLKALCGAEFRLRLLVQTWARPFPDEARALDLSAAHRMLVREVLLQWQDRPLVAARSIIPTRTLRGPLWGLARLGERPLGELLFASPRLERSGFELAEVDPAAWRSERVGMLELGTRAWGRRSRYVLDQGPLLVAEVFLPSLFHFESRP